MPNSVRKSQFSQILGLWPVVSVSRFLSFLQLPGGILDFLTPRTRTAPPRNSCSHSGCRKRSKLVPEGDPGFVPVHGGAQDPGGALAPYFPGVELQEGTSGAVYACLCCSETGMDSPISVAVEVHEAFLHLSGGTERSRSCEWS